MVTKAIPENETFGTAIKKAKKDFKNGLEHN